MRIESRGSNVQEAGHFIVRRQRQVSTLESTVVRRYRRDVSVRRPHPAALASDTDSPLEEKC